MNRIKKEIDTANSKYLQNYFYIRQLHLTSALEFKRT